MLAKKSHINMIFSSNKIECQLMAGFPLTPIILFDIGIYLHKKRVCVHCFPKATKFLPEFGPKNLTWWGLFDHFWICWATLVWHHHHTDKVVIEWYHLHKELATSKSSIFHGSGNREVFVVLVPNLKSLKRDAFGNKH